MTVSRMMSTRINLLESRDDIDVLLTHDGLLGTYACMCLESYVLQDK
jgi:hypothetical protein